MKSKHSALVMLSLVYLFSANNIHAQENTMDHLLPVIPEGWQADGESELFDRESIFQYMNGAGEVYRSYDYKNLLVQRYKKQGEEGVTVELFDMGNPADAYGIFLRNRMSSSVGIGNDSEYRSGYLVFWKGKYFASVFTYAETDEARNAVFTLAQSIADKIEDSGARPALMKYLPEKNKNEYSERYFHLYTDLNERYFLSDENILNLGDETRCALASYTISDEEVFLLIVQYPDPAHARSALAEFRTTYFRTDDETSFLQLENSLWTAATETSDKLIFVFDAPDKEEANSLLLNCVRLIKGDKDE